MDSNSPQIEKVTVTLPDHLRRRFKALTALESYAMGSIIKLLLEEYLIANWETVVRFASSGPSFLEETDDESYEKLLVALPTVLARLFKVITALQDSTMTEALRNLVQGYVVNNWNLVVDCAQADPLDSSAGNVPSYE